MGDRCNIVVSRKSTEGKSLAEILAAGCVVLYSHWGGFDMPECLRLALAKHARWDDPPYLTRIIFDHLVGPKGWGDETGFGIDTCIGDNERPIMVVDCERKLVLQFGGDSPGTIAGKGWTFEAFAKKQVARYATT